MLKNKKILALIPARGGSKRIQRKNVKDLAGKPLIAYMIGAALKSKYLPRVIVTTENKEIAEIAKRQGVEIIKRPKRLATDKAKSIDVVLHALNVLEIKGYKPDIVVWLQPTSPLTTHKDIDKAIEICIKNRYQSVCSVCEAEPSPYWCLKLEKKHLRPFLGKKYLITQGQDLPKIYLHNGAIFISTPKTIKKYKNFYASKILPYIMPKEKSVDVNEPIDFLLAGLLLKKNNR